MPKPIEDYFIDLVSLDSESHDERGMADRLTADLKAMGALVTEDDAAASTGGNAGNIFARFPGIADKAPILLCAHIDTVKPGCGIKARKTGTRIESDGTTILGADDKSGVAQIIHGIRKAQGAGIPLAPIEVLFTVCEEIGLLGAKAFDKSVIRSALGYAFDSRDLNSLTIAAPSQNSIRIDIFGKEAHAGVEPEKGINAIRIAAEAISIMPMGRIDFETTCNIGVINGGISGNIVPNHVHIKGEARSHNARKLQQVCDDMRRAVELTVEKHEHDSYKAKADISIRTEYTKFNIADDHPVIANAINAMLRIGLKADLRKGGGGSDANIINAAGIPMIICGTGMTGYHTVEEHIEIADLEKGVELVAALIGCYSQS
ncbi:MAG: M20/M25/M40 family metallo-hydrolase [Candidatus Cloacimonetes bacterium]|nr:M20/M25/M40 family metallo-hydrolase [Candidatus Cloacimonadota bacterium]